MKTEIMETTFGVVPSQDDLEWVWEDIQDGVLLQDLLLCSVLPSPQKPSAVFVEAHENVNNNKNSGYEEEQEDEYMNEWYNNSNNNLKHQQQQHLPSNIVLSNEIQTSNVIPPSTYVEYHNYQYHPNQTIAYTHQVQNDTTMDYTSSTSSAPATENLPAQQLPFLPESEVTAFLNSNRPSTTNNTEVVEQQRESYRSGVSSVYSNSSWDSFADDSSHTTELSQEEIFEEIQRECAEIERKSMSPKLEKSSSRSKKQSRSSRKLNAEERKKELNRAAAAKYREKRRIEREGKMVELEKLEIRNRKLRSEANGLENEIKYLRELIQEIRTRREEQS
jgi:hypothetical protein